jgi:hypothetical protein
MTVWRRCGQVSLGGVIVVDDWRLDGMQVPTRSSQPPAVAAPDPEASAQARTAVIDFFAECDLEEKLNVAEDGIAWWRKTSVSNCG